MLAEFLLDAGIMGYCCYLYFWKGCIMFLEDFLGREDLPWESFHGRFGSVGTIIHHGDF